MLKIILTLLLFLICLSLTASSFYWTWGKWQTGSWGIIATTCFVAMLFVLFFVVKRLIVCIIEYRSNA